MDTEPEPMETGQEEVFEDVGLITEEEMASLGLIHEQIFTSLTRKLWLEKQNLPDVKYSTASLMTRLEMLHTLLPSVLTRVDSNVDAQLAGKFPCCD